MTSQNTLDELGDGPTWSAASLSLAPVQPEPPDKADEDEAVTAAAVATLP